MVFTNIIDIPKTLFGKYPLVFPNGVYKQQASIIITRCADYSSPPPLWTDRRCPPSCSCMSPKGLSCQSSPALLSDYYSLSRRQPAAFLPPACLAFGGRLCAAIEKRVLYRVSWLNDINSSHPVCQAMPLRQKAVGLLFKVFFIIQTSLMQSRVKLSNSQQKIFVN